MTDNKIKIELLAPAGDMERLQAAVEYGADAVYLAGKTFGMRAAPANFTDEQLVEAVDEDVGDVEVACVQTADKALQEGQGTCHLVILVFDQTDTAVNIVTQLGAIFNADQAADFIFHCFVDVVDELLGLAGALQTHN